VRIFCIDFVISLFETLFDDVVFVMMLNESVVSMLLGFGFDVVVVSVID
jgi:hypothetical protein